MTAVTTVYWTARAASSGGERPLKVHGNINGLKPGQRQRLERLYNRKVPREAIVSVPLAVSMTELSAEIGRQIGITIDRRGRIKHVIVGDADQLFIPDLGRSRAGEGRFRGIRLVHTHLRDEPLTEDDITDLVRLRLDMIAAIGVGRDGRPATLYHTHMLPSGSELPYADPTVTSVHAEKTDFAVFIDALEEEFSRRTVGAIETDGATRAIAVHVTTTTRDLDPQTSLRELAELARTADVLLVDKMIQKRPRFDPKYVLGKGKLNDLLLMTMQLDCELVIFDQNLSPNQVRAIAEVTDVKVIDRSQLILDIFARRAHTREGKLSVELAQLRYLLPRLAQRTTAFSRLAGGIGGRGPGETKLEIDRRRARDRINQLERELKQCEVQRNNRRNRRNRRRVPVVALVGYTNAGKSTLFNAITQSDVLSEDKLFATLHVTTRRLRFPQDREVVIIDTVGFIRDLPDDLKSAFRATLEELEEADLLLHVVDVGDPRMAQQIASVEQVLADMELLDTPRMRVFNKVDQLEPALAEAICAQNNAIGVSALDRPSVRPLMEAIETRLWQAGRGETAYALAYQAQLAEQIQQAAEEEAQLQAEIAAEEAQYEAEFAALAAEEEATQSD
jgi:GTP-binding protein HflX